MSERKAKLLLSKTHPKLAKEAHGWDPSVVSTFSNKSADWICTKGHIWKATISNRSRLNRGCPYCSNQKVSEGENDLATVYPELAKESHGWDPSKVIAGTGKKLTWRCDKGHSWKALVSNRLRGDNCTVCAGKVVLFGFNDLSTRHPLIANQANGWDPKKVYFQSGKKLKWICSEGHTWHARVSHRTFRGQGCPYCSNQRVLTGFNDLLTKFPEIAAEADGWDPSIVVAGSQRLSSWICLNGHQWKATSAHRTGKRKTNCPYCTNRKVLVGFNDLASRFPKIAREAFGWNPKTVTGGSDAIKKWKCSNGHVWKARVANRVHGRGCPSCSTSGFDPNLEGYLYLLMHPIWEMYQIGITNFPEKRLASHSGRGWQIIELRGPMEGSLAQDWETGMLRMLKAKKANLGDKERNGIFDGFTESWSMDTYAIQNIFQLMRETEEFEENQRL